MVENELWSRHRLLTLLIAGIVGLALSGCSAASRRPMVGTEMTLQAEGGMVEVHYIIYPHLDRGRKMYGIVSKRSPKTMALIGAGGFKEFPSSITFEWISGFDEDAPREQWEAQGKLNRKTIDLNLIPDAALQEVRVDPKKKLLQLTFTFKDDDVSMKWAVYKWR